MSTGLELARATPEAREAYLRSLVDAGAQALVLELVQWLREVPDDMLRAARLMEFPLVVFREEVRFADLTKEAHELILRPHRPPNAEHWLDGLLDALVETGRSDRFLRGATGTDPGPARPAPRHAAGHAGGPVRLAVQRGRDRPAPGGAPPERLLPAGTAERAAGRPRRAPPAHRPDRGPGAAQARRRASTGRATGPNSVQTAFCPAFDTVSVESCLRPRDYHVSIPRVIDWRPAWTTSAAGHTGRPRLHALPVVGPGHGPTHPHDQGPGRLVLGRRRQQVDRFLLADHERQHRAPAPQGARGHQAPGGRALLRGPDHGHRAQGRAGQEAGRGHRAGQGLLLPLGHRGQRERHEDRQAGAPAAARSSPGTARITATPWAP